MTNDKQEILENVRRIAGSGIGRGPNVATTVLQQIHDYALDALSRQSQQAQGEALPMYLIWSNEHNCYWRPNSAGYTRSIDDAGRYTYAEADGICKRADYRCGSDLATDVPPEIMVLAPECHPPAPVAVPGYKLVPLEPTIEMIAALAWNGDEDMAIGHGAITSDIVERYKAMLAAIPTDKDQQQAALFRAHNGGED